MIKFRHCFAGLSIWGAWRKISRFQSPQSDPPETPLDPHLTYPPDNDLRRLLRFEPHRGAIWSLRPRHHEIPQRLRGGGRPRVVNVFRIRGLL